MEERRKVCRKGEREKPEVKLDRNKNLKTDFMQKAKVGV